MSPASARCLRNWPAHWLTVEGLPKYAWEFNDIEPIWRDLKAHHLAHQTFAAPDADQGIHQAVAALKCRTHASSVGQATNLSLDLDRRVRDEALDADRTAEGRAGRPAAGKGLDKLDSRGYVETKGAFDERFAAAIRPGSGWSAGSKRRSRLISSSR